MKIIDEDVDLKDFKAWSEGRNVLDRLIEYGTVGKAQTEIEEMFPDGITDTQLNDYLWFQIEDDHPEWFDDNREEKEEIRRKVEETHHSEGPLGFLTLMEAEDGTLYRLNYEDDDDDFTVFKLVAESQFVTNNMSGWSSDYEIDYDFSKSFEDNVQALKDEMLSDGVYPALPSGMEYVESFPCWAIAMFANSDYSGLDEKDIYEANLWAAENGYGMLAEAYEETRNGFDRHPAFGLACDTELVAMNKVGCQIWLVRDSKRDSYLQSECHELVSFETEEAARKWIEAQPNKEDLSPEKVYDPGKGDSHGD